MLFIAIILMFGPITVKQEAENLVHKQALIEYYDAIYCVEYMLRLEAKQD